MFLSIFSSHSTILESGWCCAALSDTLVCSMALTFFTHTDIFQSTGVSEIPADEIFREVVEFTCPCILRIIDNHIATGGVFVTPKT
jgi:hypothetical protein